MANRQDSELVHGPAYTAVLLHNDKHGARPYVHALVYGPKNKGDLTYQRFVAYASSEGKKIYAPKILSKGESRPFIDLAWDLDTAVVKCWDDVLFEHKEKAKDIPRSMVLEGIWSFESFLMYGFARGVLADPEHSRVLQESGHPMPNDLT